LCKRFNVKPPANVGPGAADSEDGAAAGGSGGTKDVVSQASLDRMMREANWGGLASSSGGGKGFVSGGVEGGDEEVAKPARQAPDRVDAERNEALETQRAGEEVFKAIFGSDDEDDE
jgi:G patch domain-containing protein 1